jgi:hypothetical protein
MNFNFIKEKESSNLYNNIRYKNHLLLSNDSNKENYPFFISKEKVKERIAKIKKKYGSLYNSSNTILVNRKIQILKNKYMNSQNIQKKININNAIHYSGNNNTNSKLKLLSRNNQKKNMFRSSSLKFVKESNFNFNKLYNTYKNENKNHIIINNKSNNKETDKDNQSKATNDSNKSKFGYNFKYLRNIKEDFISVHKKLKELLQNDAFNKSKKRLTNMIFPISKKINLLSDMKKDIKNVNKNSFGYMTISPKSTISTSSDYTLKGTTHLFNELFSEENIDSIKNSVGRIKKPNLIRSLTKPKLDVPKYTNLYNMKI